MYYLLKRSCPVETSVFPNLQKIPGSKSLEAPFQAFRFASDSTVRFQVTVSFCLNECNPVRKTYFQFLKEKIKFARNN